MLIVNMAKYASGFNLCFRSQVKYTFYSAVTFQ